MHLRRRPLRAARVSDESHRVTTFELFFDLVFVFAFTQVTGFMAQEHTFLGVLQGMIILSLLWWSWVAFAWLGNQTHVDEGIMRLGLAVVMVAMFIAALAIPVAMLPGSALIFTGALIGGTAQTWLWAAGLALDITLTYLTSTGGNWRLPSATHWTERHGLVVILALGESIVATGVGASREPVSIPILLGAVFGIALSVCPWWLHFDVTAIAAEHRFAALRGSERVAAAVDAYSYLHLPLVAGIVLSAFRVEDVLAHVYSTEDFGLLGSFALFGGAALFLLAARPSGAA